MSKRLMRAILGLTLLSLAVGVAMAGAQGSSNEFRSKLNGTAAKTNSKATGSATYEISSSGKSIKYTLRATGLSGPVQAAHIHFGKPGVAGDVLIAICPGPCSLPRSGTLTVKQFNKNQKKAGSFASAIKAIRAGNTYTNVHTKKFPQGEIRGQLRADT